MDVKLHEPAPMDRTLPGRDSEGWREAHLEYVRGWLPLAISMLLLAGVLALVLVVARTPPFSSWITDAFMFRRILVVHVDLSLVVWLYAFTASMFCLLPSSSPKQRSARWGLRVSTLGTILIVAAAAVPNAEPVLANYIPMIDHPMFLAGLVVFAVGVAISFLEPQRFFGRPGTHEIPQLPGSACAGLRAMAITFLLALVTFATAAVTTPRGLTTETYYEFLVWGGGHVLQFTSVIAMVTVWIILVTRATGVPAVGPRVGAWLFALLVAPLLAAPLLAGNGTTTILYYDGFTQLMRWGIFPALAAFLILCGRALWKAGRDGQLPPRPLRDPNVAGFLASAGLASLGVVLGFLIRGSNTVVPGHYHAAIGAVTVAFMALSYPLMQRTGLRLAVPFLQRAKSWQPLVFAGGQAVFALGFTIAGMHGSGRKVYGQEQQIRTLGEYVGLSVMGIGGLIAVAGGLLFLTIAVASWLPARHSFSSRRSVRTPCQPSINIPSRN